MLLDRGTPRQWLLLYSVIAHSMFNVPKQILLLIGICCSKKESHVCLKTINNFVANRIEAETDSKSQSLPKKLSSSLSIESMRIKKQKKRERESKETLVNQIIIRYYLRHFSLFYLLHLFAISFQKTSIILNLRRCSHKCHWVPAKINNLYTEITCNIR